MLIVSSSCQYVLVYDMVNLIVIVYDVGLKFRVYV